MAIQEIPARDLDSKKFIEEQAKAIHEAVGPNLAINALSGGVDSSAVTMIGNKALGDRLKTYFVNNGLMREGEPERVVSLFRELGVHGHNGRNACFCRSLSVHGYFARRPRHRHASGQARFRASD